MIRRAVIDIDLQALAHNFSHIQSKLNGQKILAMVKADAYGHGMLQVVDALPNADAFGVATVGEGVFLREQGACSAPIVVMSGFQDMAELRLCDQHQLQCVIHCNEQLAQLKKIRLKQPMMVWLKVDTGMHRLGFYSSQVEQAYQALKDNASVQTPLGLMTHLACAGEPEDAMSAEQLKQFSQLTAIYPSFPVSIANSSCILRLPHSLGDWVRPGVMLYGVSPFIEGSSSLDPVMTLKAPVIAVKSLHKGDAVGYGATWVSPGDVDVAIIGLGYGDGYPQTAPSGTPVLLNGQSVFTVGRVSMDTLVVDITHMADVKVGNMVELWGKSLSVNDVARVVDGLPYDLLCRAGMMNR